MAHLNNVHLAARNNTQNCLKLKLHFQVSSVTGWCRVVGQPRFKPHSTTSKKAQTWQTRFISN